jgi:cytochrome c peroxidase
LSFALESCRKNDVFNSTTPFIFNVPAGFPPTAYNFSANPLNKETIELGRHLFYEGKLSKDGKFPCSSCHQQAAAFTTYEHDRSHGYNNSHTKRNAPGLYNLAWLNSYGQDGAFKNLEDLILSHITSPTEMAETMPGVVKKLSDEEKYRQLFKDAYGSSTINSQKIINALKQFVLSITSTNSKYDKVKRGEAIFNQIEENGYQVFKANCASCHVEPLFTDNSFRNVGLELDPQLNDFGRMEVTKNRDDSLKFRMPSLRNAELTAYYFHDGRFSTVYSVLNHYANGIKQSPTLDPALKNGIQLNNTQVVELVTFIKTLTDSSILTNKNYGPPQ